MDVRLPTGEIVRNVPDGMDKADLVAKLRASGKDVSWAEAPDPITPPAAQAPVEQPPDSPGIGTRLKNAFGLASPEEEQQLAEAWDQGDRGVINDVGQLTKRSGARLVRGVAELPGAAVRAVTNTASEMSPLVGVPKETGAKIGEALFAPVTQSEPLQATQDWAKEKEAEAVNALSSDARRAIELSLVERDEEGKLHLGEGATDPNWWLANVIDVAVQAAPGFGTGAIAARTSYAAKYRQVLGELAGQKIPHSVALKEAEKQAMSAAKRAAVIAGGLTEGGTAGGQNAGQVRDAIESLDEETLMAYPGYMELRDQGKSHEQARAIIAKDKAASVAIASGALVGLTGAPMNAYFGKLVARLGRMEAAPTIVGRLATAGKGALGEGAQEFVQEGGEQVIQNKVMQPITGEGTWDGVLENAITGAVLGGVIGGGVDLAVSGKEGKAKSASKEEPKAEEAPALRANVEAAKAAFDSANQALAEAEIAARDPEIKVKYADIQKLREAKKQAVVDYTRELLHAGMIAEKEQAKVTAALKQAETEGITAKGTGPVGGDVSPQRDAALQAVANAEQVEEADANDLIARGWAKVNPRGNMVLTPEGRRQRKAADERAKEEAESSQVAVQPAKKTVETAQVSSQPKKKQTLRLPADRHETAMQREAQRAVRAQKPRKELEAERAKAAADKAVTPESIAGRAAELEASDAAHAAVGGKVTENPQMREAFAAAAERARRARAGLPDTTPRKNVAFSMKQPKWQVLDDNVPTEEAARRIVEGRQKKNPRMQGWDDYEFDVVKSDSAGYMVRARKKVNVAFRLKGAPETVDIPGKGKVKVEPVKAAKEAASAYKSSRGITTPEQTEFARVDPVRAKRIAKAFEEMKHEPNHPVVKRAYRAMIDETKAQWDQIKKTGLKVEFIKPGQKDPYEASPRMAIEDVRDNNHLWVFPTDSGFGSDNKFAKDNPMLEDAGEIIGGHKLKNNDVFRIVHDYFGHVQEANGFRADGEENAWRIHAGMYSPLARRAMTTETRGQNSWVNYGPKGEANRKAKAGETVYADQKIGLLPAEFSAFPGETLKFKHFSKATDDQIDLDPEMMGTGAKGAEAKRGGPKVISLYAEHGETEPDVANGRTRYNVEIPAEDLYNGSTDPQGLLRQAQVPFGLMQDDKGNMVPVGHRFDMNKFEELVRDAGYLGYHLPEANGILKGQARIFDKYPAMRDGAQVRKVEVAARMKRKASEEEVRGHLTEQERERLHSASAKKLVEVFNELPSGAELAAAAVAGQAKRGWYRRSAQALSNVFGPDAPRFAALLAALSPQTSVEWNFKNAVAVWVGWDKAGRPTDRKKILFLMRDNLFPGSNRVGKSKVLGAWVNNTVRALTAEDPSSVVLSGPKVDSFAANLRGETERVTLDAWMANWAGVDQALFKGELNVDGTNPGMRPGYLAFAARVREAAAILSKRTGETWTPAEVQETVWSWAKTLYEQAESYGALATARELVDNNELTDELINATPDFAGQFADPQISTLLAGTVYGPRAARSNGQVASERRAAGKTAPAPEDAGHLRKAADRLDALRKSRKEAEAETRAEAALATKNPQTETPEFKAWFGNSKVVNPDGTPMVVYHATAADFDTFRRRPGDIGLHFGTQEQAADRFNYGRERGRYDEAAAESVMPVYLSIKNPLRMDDAGSWNADNMGHMLNRLFPDAREQIFRMRSAADVRKFLQARGYDGIVYKNTGEVNDAARGKELRAQTSAAWEKLKARRLREKAPLNAYDTESQRTPEYKAWSDARSAESDYRHNEGSADSFIAFERTQVKSAVGNYGAFDPKNPNITARMGSRPERGLPMADLQQVADRVTRELGVTANVANTQADLPDYIQVNIPEGAVVTGMFVEDPLDGSTEIWYVRENLDSVDEAYENALHEAVGHMGLRAVLGNSYHKVMADIRRSFPEKTAWAERQNGIDAMLRDARARSDHATVRRLESLAAEELVAYAAGKVLQKRGALSQQSVWRRIVAKVREILRGVGLLNNYSDEDVEALIYRARDFFRKPARLRAQEIDYRARMAAAVKNQPDGTPQWLTPDEYVEEDGDYEEFLDNLTTLQNGDMTAVEDEAVDSRNPEQITFSPNFDAIMRGEDDFMGQGEVNVFADGKRIGYVTIDQNDVTDDTWTALYVYVKPAYRGKGVAQRMYAAISKRLGKKPAPASTRTPFGRKMWDSFNRRKVAFRVKEGSKRQIDSSAFKEWFGESKIVDADGSPKVLYHGTHGDFDTFDRASPDSYFGPGFYFTDDPDDASNYASLRHPDIRARVENEIDRARDDMDAISNEKERDLRRARALVAEQRDVLDRIVERREAARSANDQQAFNSVVAEENAAYERLRDAHAAVREAERARDEVDETFVKTVRRERLGHVNEGSVLPVFMRMERPLIIGDGETQFYLEYPQTEDGDQDFEAEPTGNAAVLIDALMAHNLIDVVSWLQDNALDGVSASRVVEKVKAALWESEDGVESLQDIFVRAGFDGVIDKMAGIRWRGVTPRGATHYTVFDPSQIKSAVGNTGKFSRKDPRIAFAFKQGPTGNADLDSFISKVGVRPLSLKQRWQQFKHGLKERAAMAFFDELHGIKAAEDIAGIPEGDQGYVSARLSRAAPEVVASIIENGPPVWNDGAPDVGQGMGLLSILAPLKGNVNLWLAYVAGRRANMLASQGRENLFTPAEIKAAMDLAQQHPEFDVARQQYNKLQKQVLDFAEEAGVIDPNTRALWEHADYVPFYRIMQGGEVTVPSKGSSGIGFVRNQIKQLKGGRQNIGDPLENIVRNWQALMDASLQAYAGRMTIDNLNGTGLVTPHKFVANAQPIQSLNALLQANPAMASALTNAGINVQTLPPAAMAGLQKMLGIAPPAGEDVVTVWRGGKKEFWHVHDPNLFRSLKNINPKLWGPWMKLFAFPKRVVTKTITLTPQFMVKNFWRDMWHTFVTGAQSDKTRINMLPSDSIAGLTAALANSPDYRSMVAGGGGFGESFVESGDPASMAASVRRAINKGKARGIVLNTPVKVWRFYRSLQNAAENANRVAVYKKSRKAGLSRRNALYQARDLMDFSMRGNAEIVRLIVGMTPFFNARLQGLYRLGRGMTHSKQAFASVAIRGLLLSFATLALLARNHDDERYKELTDQQKSNYWHIFTADGHYMLPKPFEVGTIFGTVPEALGDAMIQDEPDAVKQAAKYVGYSFGETLNLAPQPATVWPLVELAINQDTFTGAPILTQGDENVLPEDQRGPNTSATYAALAGLVPEDAPEALRSPKQLEHLGRGYIGNIQDYVLLASDALVRKVTGEPAPPEKATRDLPGIRDFYRTGPARNTRYITEMYKLADEAAKVQASISKAEKAETTEGDARIEELEEKYPQLLDVADDFKDAAKQVTDLKKEQRQIQLDEHMSPDEKREEIDEIQKEINDIAKDVYDLRPGGKLNPNAAADLLVAPPTARATILRKNNMPATAALLEQFG